MTPTPGAVALVTGAAGGIGQHIVAVLADRGWTVAASDLPGTGVDFPADLRTRPGCVGLIETVVAASGRLDLLVNNAASMNEVALTVEGMATWWEDVAVDLAAPLWLTQAAAPHLRAVGGQVINIASVSGLRGEPGFSAYAACKAGLVGMTRSLARELAPDVRVNAVAPGHTDTPQLSRDADLRGLTMAKLHEVYAAELPIGRLIQPREVAELVAYLAQAEAFTGECVQINGGLLMA